MANQRSVAEQLAVTVLKEVCPIVDVEEVDPEHITLLGERITSVFTDLDGVKFIFDLSTFEWKSTIDDNAAYGMMLEDRSIGYPCSDKGQILRGQFFELVDHKEAKRLQSVAEKLQQSAIQVKPHIDALVSGHTLQFRHNDGEFRDHNACNLQEILMSPHRFRIKR